MFTSINDTDFHFYNHNKCKNLTTNMTPREVLFNYNLRDDWESNYKYREV